MLVARNDRIVGLFIYAERADWKYICYPDPLQDTTAFIFNGSGYLNPIFAD